MASSSASIEKTGLRFGIIAGIAHIIFALILHLTGLSDVPSLRFGFIIIGIIFICSAIKAVKNGRDGKLNYLQGIGAGFITSLVSSFMLGLFILLAVSFFNSNIMDILRNENLLGEHITPGQVFMVITMIGMIGGALVGFIAMQWYKRPDHKLTK